MFLLMDEEAIKAVLDWAKIKYKRIENIEVLDYEFVHTSRGAYHLIKAKDKKCNAVIVELDDIAVWSLEEFLNPVEYQKVKLEQEGLKQEIYYYKQRTETGGSVEISLQEVVRNDEQMLQLKHSDIYLMIPGMVKEEDWKDFGCKSNDLFDIYKNEIDARIADEYDPAFAESIERKCIGVVTLKINDILNGMTYLQRAIIGIARHDSGFAIVEIMVPNCNIGGNKLLNYYCGNYLFVIHEGKEYILKDFLESKYVMEYGKKRSVVFSYGDTSKQEIINALANEEFPMGTIGGKLRDKVENENIAFYDTAEVYVSEETMIENCKKRNNDIEMRISYHAIELFFVELLLFKDAAVDKVYVDLAKEEQLQREYVNVQKARMRCERLSFDMAKALRVGDFDKFNFPTTRESAKNVAEHFGIDTIYDKYKLNKEFLESMVEANTRQMLEEQDVLKNRFLIIISAIAFIGTLGEILYNIVLDKEVGTISYSVAIILLLSGYLLYLIIEKIRVRRSMNRSRQ